MSFIWIHSRFSPDFTWALLKGIVKWFHASEQNGRHAYIKIIKNLLLQNKESTEAESWYIALGYKQRRLKVNQICSNNDHRLTFDFFTARSLRPLHLYWEKSLSQNVSKTNGWNIQCMIKELKLLVTIHVYIFFFFFF